jgi:hypothetical protein
MTKLSYFDDFTPDERDMVRLKMIEEGQSWDEILKRFGHPKDWKDQPLQFNMFKELQ